MDGLNNLKGLFKTKWFYDSILYTPVIIHYWITATATWGQQSLACSYPAESFPARRADFPLSMHMAVFTHPALSFSPFTVSLGRSEEDLVWELPGAEIIAMI